MGARSNKMGQLKDQIAIIDKYGEAVKALALFAWMVETQEVETDLEEEVRSLVESMEDDGDFTDLERSLFTEKIVGIEMFVKAAELLGTHLVPKLREAAEKGNNNGVSQPPYGW